jgi:hypothetical protein
MELIMDNIKTDCPHCYTKDVALVYRAHNLIDQETDTEKKINRYNIFWSCNHCGKGVVTLSEHITSSLPNIYNNFIYSKHFKTLAIYPSLVPSEAPADTPLIIAAAFIEGMDNLLQGNWGDCAVNMRQTLELAAIDLDKTGITTNKWLAEKLAYLKQAKIINEALAEWAAQIKYLGNTAVHEFRNTTEEPSACFPSSFSSPSSSTSITSVGFLRDGFSGSENSPGRKP